jgi:hypothetical protein
MTEVPIKSSLSITNEIPLIRLKRNIEKLRDFDQVLTNTYDWAPATVCITIKSGGTEFYYSIRRCLNKDRDNGSNDSNDSGDNNEIIIYGVSSNFSGGCSMSQSNDTFLDFDDLFTYLESVCNQYDIDLNQDSERFTQQFVEAKQYYHTMLNYVI